MDYYFQFANSDNSCVKDYYHRNRIYSALIFQAISWEKAHKKNRKNQIQTMRSMPRKVIIRYRIQYDGTNNWYQVCPQCWQIVAVDNPNYRYGGT